MMLSTMLNFSMLSRQPIRDIAEVKTGGWRRSEIQSHI
jgi:hypothetical protein